MRSMRAGVGVLAGTVALLGALSGPVQALTITRASVSRGVVAIAGHAAGLADIAWEGSVVTTSSRRGAFSFTTTTLPAGCVGALSDGVSTIGVAIGGCTVDTPPPPNPLLASGQTTCWDVIGHVVGCAGTGQDGEVRAGAVQRYTSRADGTIADANTGLVWEKKTAANMFDVYMWDEAFDYVAGLNAARLAGHADWRLPNIRELQSLIDYGRFDPAVAPELNDCDHGSCTVSGSYWSSTTAESAGILAWRVNFYDGFQLVGGKTFGIRVRAVRGGP